MLFLEENIKIPTAEVKWVCQSCSSFQWGFWVGFRLVCVGFAMSAKVFNTFLGVLGWVSDGFLWVFA